jgi:glycosyltransferase involved in cell wall biosynthesis
MKYAVIISLLLSNLGCLWAKVYDPYLVVVIMIKNEAQRIVETLEPFVDGGIDSFVVFDTGSTDGTQKKVKGFFKEKKVARWFLCEEPFIDFATSRNHALDKAEELFPDALFIIMPDAEWYIHNAAGLLELCKRWVDMPGDCHLIRLVSNNLDCQHGRLIRAHTDTRFKGSVHEVICKQAIEYVPADIYFTYSPTEKGDNKSRQRWQRDAELLLRDYNKDPEDPRTAFYLAQTYHFLADIKNARRFYKKRVRLEGYEEERFIAMYRIGITYEQEAEKVSDERLWEKAIFWYLKAFALRPHRAEPIVALAYHYLRQDMLALAFLFAQYAVTLAYPDPRHDVLFIEKENYIYGRYSLLARLALKMGKYEIGEWAADCAITARPESLEMVQLKYILGDRRRELSRSALAASLS